MKRTGQADHLSSSLTDLMTSLMVIFVLLLVTKLNNQATEVTAAVNRILRELKAHAQDLGDAEKIEAQGDVIVIVIPDELMSFRQGEAELSESGRQYLRRHVFGWSALLCNPELRRDVDTIVVEGHADRRTWRNLSRRDSELKNLELSQQRSMAVVGEVLGNLEDSSLRKSCFLDLLSATGRGEAHPLDRTNPDSERNRRVELRIRVRPNAGERFGAATGGVVSR